MHLVRHANGIFNDHYHHLYHLGQTLNCVPLSENSNPSPHPLHTASTYCTLPPIGDNNNLLCFLLFVGFLELNFH